MDWTTPEDVRDEVERAWERGRILAARVTGEPAFPMRLRLRKPDRRALSDRFDEVRRWIRSLEEGSKAKRGFGYEIEWLEIDHRQLGRNRVPDVLTVPTESDALQLIAKRRAADRFDANLALTAERLPLLRDWVARKPMRVVEHADDWPRVVDVVAWMVANPRPNIYVRQIDLAGVDTKFIEARRPLITELIDELVPSEQSKPGAGFEARFGLRSKPTLVRFRHLDPNVTLGGLTDIATPVSQLAMHAPSGKTVFITENEINGLAFPNVEDAIVIFGLGYGVDVLSELTWLRERAVYYWGDIDTHGFAILSRLRGYVPAAQSLLMDRVTLLAHRTHWSEERAQHAGPLTRLTTDESALFDELVSNAFGVGVRLEQERIEFGHLHAELAKLGAG